MAKKTVKTAKKNAPRRFEVMDTTLRDGEQTEGVSILGTEKMTIARCLLEQVRVDRIEVASARVSKGELETVRMICDWAAERDLLDHIEILGFTDHKATADWANEAGCRVINLLTKGSREHCEGQLRKTFKEHLADIRQTVEYGNSLGIDYNVYLEDWSGGMLRCPEYVYGMLDAYMEIPFKRLMLPDTLGLLEPRQVTEFVADMVRRYPKAHFDFHPHNDYGLGVANVLAALEAGAHGIHTTVNCLGERTGNAALDETVVAARDFAGFETGAVETELKNVSRLVEVFTGRRVAWNKPIVGENVFTQTAGIHADGDSKGSLYESSLTPQRFGRDRVYAMGKLMGKASLDFNLKKLNIDLTAEQKKAVLARIIELGDSKKAVTATDLPYIIADVLNTPEGRVFEVIDFAIVSNKGLKPVASVRVRLGDKEFQGVATGDGGYDAFMKAIHAMKKELGFTPPKLHDYSVRIPPGGKTDALVETTIDWEGGLVTHAVSSDQLAAAIEATSNMLNMVAQRKRRRKKS